MRFFFKDNILILQTDTGHVAAIILYHKLFQQAIVDSLDLNARKYHNSKILEKSFLDREKEKESLIAKN